MTLKLYTSKTKLLKLKFRKFWELISRFVKVTRKKLVEEEGDFLPPFILNRVKVFIHVGVIHISIFLPFLSKWCSRLGKSVISLIVFWKTSTKFKNLSIKQVFSSPCKVFHILFAILNLKNNYEIRWSSHKYGTVKKYLWNYFGYMLFIV